MAVTKIGQYAFYKHPNLETVRTSATTIEQDAFYNAINLKTVDLTSNSSVTIENSVFTDAYNLKHLIIRSNSLSTLAATTVLNGTKIARGEGAIYVPSNLLNTYKTSSNWNTYADYIYPIDDYPITNFDNIKDTWATILSNSSYAIDYAIGDVKTLELTDGTEIKMQIVAFDTDDKSNETGKAKITWLCKNVPDGFDRSMMNSGRYYVNNDWETSDARAWLISDVLSKIPSEIKSHIVSVKKSFRSKVNGDQTLTCDDEIWLPSYCEVNGYYSANNAYTESSGNRYSSFFTSDYSANANNNSRIKYYENGVASTWWLRTAAAASRLYSFISLTGSIGAETSVTKARSMVFGFCTD